MTITAQDVKKLRDATGAGMMDAKKALTEAEGDFVKATEILRITGQTKAAKRSDREASNGLVAAAGSTLVKLAAETDFVAKTEVFTALAQTIVEAVDKAGVEGKVEAGALVIDGDDTIDDKIGELAAKIGEKLELAEVAHFDGTVSTYLHRRSQDLPPQVGVMVQYEGDDADFVHSICLQIAAMNPQYVSEADVPEDVVANERRIAEATAREEGKPEKAIPRIVEGRLHGFYKDFCLVDQPAVSDDKKTVGKLLQEHGVTVKRFVRLSAGA